MASNVELLEKSKKKFTPTKYRAWEDVFEQPLREIDKKNNLSKKGDLDDKCSSNRASTLSDAENINKFQNNSLDKSEVVKNNILIEKELGKYEKDKIIENTKLLVGNGKAIMMFLVSECVKTKSNATDFCLVRVWQNGLMRFNRNGK